MNQKKWEAKQTLIKWLRYQGLQTGFHKRCIVLLVVVAAVVDNFFFLGFMSKAMVIHRTAGKSRDHF